MVNSEALAAASFGTLIGLGLAQHNGVPTIFIIVVIALALGFGIWSSAARPKDPDIRREAMRLARINAGVLFMISVSMTWILNLSLPSATMAALVTGLIGSNLIDKLETSPAGQGLAELVATVLAFLAKGGK